MDDGFSSLQRELRDEKAAALARIGGVLQETINSLLSLRRQLDQASPSERPRLIQTYRLLRRRATTYRWYLEVQREAVGFRSHDLIDTMYPIPAPVD